MSNKQIHLIDDDPLNNLINRKLIARIFPDAEITEDVNAKDALEKIRNEFRPDIILLDLNMPGMNGWEFLEHFQKLDKEITIYILTSSIDSEDYRKAERHKYVKKYIEKPLNIQKITNLFV